MLLVSRAVLLLSVVSSVVVSVMAIEQMTSSSPSPSTTKANNETFSMSTPMSSNPSSPAEGITASSGRWNNTSPNATTSRETFSTSTAMSSNPSSPAEGITASSGRWNNTSPNATTLRDPTSTLEPHTSISSTIHVNTTDLTGNTTSASSSATTSTLSTSLTTLLSSLTKSTNVTEANENITPNAETVGSIAENPGLVAVLCIFFIVVALVLTIGIAKALSSKKNKFEKLDDLPMSKMNEDSPFARYPPK